MSLSDKYRRLADTILHERAWGQFKDNDALTLDEWKLIDTALRVMADAAPSTRETGQWCPSCGTAMVDVPFEPIAAQQVPPVRGGDDVRETEGLAALKPSQPVAQFSAIAPTWNPASEEPKVSGSVFVDYWTKDLVAGCSRFTVGDKLGKNILCWRYRDGPSVPTDGGGA